MHQQRQRAVAKVDPGFRSRQLREWHGAIDVAGQLRGGLIEGPLRALRVPAQRVQSGQDLCAVRALGLLFGNPLAHVFHFGHCVRFPCHVLAIGARSRRVSPAGSACAAARVALPVAGLSGAGQAGRGGRFSNWLARNAERPGISAHATAPGARAGGVAFSARMTGRQASGSIPDVARARGAAHPQRTGGGRQPHRQGSTP